MKALKGWWVEWLTLALRSPVLDEVLSGWRAEAPKNATDPEYEVRLHSIVLCELFLQELSFQVLRVEGVETEGSIVVDPEISFNK